MRRRAVARACGALLIVFALLAPAWAPVWAQSGGDAAAVRALEAELDALKSGVDAAKTPEQRGPLVERARVAHDKAAALQRALEEPVARTRQRIEQLGPDAAKSGDPAVRQQQGELDRELADQVALTRRTALVEVESQQLLNALAEQQARAIGAELFARTASPLTPSLWRDGVAALRQDLARPPPAAAPTPPARAPRPLALVALGLAAWLALSWLLLVPGRRALDRFGAALARRLAGAQPRSALSMFALWSALSGLALPVLAAFAGLTLAQWAAPSARVVDLAGIAISALTIGLCVRAVAQALLQPAQAQWRLWTMSDAAAALGARAGNALAAAIATILVVEATAARVGTSPASQTLLHSALAVISVTQIAYVLYLAGRMRRIEERPDGERAASERAAGERLKNGDEPSGGHLALWIGIGWLAVGLLALFGALGYVSFANRISQWAIWAGVVILATALLMAFVDDLCKLLATARGRGRAAQPPNRALQQAAVLLSAICRLLLLALACGALLVPFGAGFTSVLSLLTPLAQGFEVGGVTISAGALLRALLAFAVVLALIRFVRAWIIDSYLPTTRLQADARDSIDKILRYVGTALAVLWALTAFGIGMEKVAILASALSVGIGFGLQAITQNFVSGLILLVERPVKIGDWVKLNDVEGDIRRINVRSTEIRVSDHSTMIVPNSELITKIVQNKTKGGSLGRAQIFLSVSLGNDLDEAIAAVLEVLSADEDVLETPAPAVFLDRVEGGMAVLNCFVHVRSPRVAYGVRSRIMLAALRGLRARGITVSMPTQQFVDTPPVPAQS